MPVPAAGPPTTPRSRLRMPRRTVRLRLTLLYGGLFLASGIGLLAITYLLLRSAGTMVILPPRGSLGNPLRVPTPPAQMAEELHDALLHQLLTQSGIALVIMAIASIGLGWLVAGRVLRPLRTITTSVRQISASNLHQRLALPGPDDEMKELGDTFDGLLVRLERAFDAQRRFVANASHELRTPLARQRTMLEVAVDDPEPTIPSLQTACQRALVAGEQQESLIEALLTLARSQRGLDHAEAIDLATIASEVVRSRRPEALRRELSINAVLDPAPALGDGRLSERLTANLLDNALRHNVTGGRVQITTGTLAGQTVLTIANTGPAIPSAEITRLFQPFQRLGIDRTGSSDGTGLGLSIVAAIVEAHDARLRARALPGGGLEIEVYFPDSSAQPRKATGRPGSTPSPRQRTAIDT